ncbi:MAG: hypothetical protein K6A44_03445 [bacterium]|nr:hypothetical protein [bacterium]
MKKVILKEVIEEERDIKYEIFRAVKTFCLIMIFFSIGFLLKKNYSDMIKNAGNMRFYPSSTVFYLDGIEEKKTEQEFPFLKNSSLISYGLVKDSHGEDKFLIAAYTPDAENTHIIPKKGYSFITLNKYTFISDSEDELLELKKRLETHNFVFLKNKNIRKALKTLDGNRSKTIIISDVSYTGIEINKDARKALNKILDKIIIQTFENDKEIKFLGDVSFENKFADAALNLNNLREKFARKSIKIEKFNEKNLALIVGVKDFDLWSTTVVKMVKSLPDNQYNATLSLIQDVFNFDIEEDIVKQLNGSAVLYLYSDKKIMHPMLLLETKKDLAAQGKKYLDYLQLTNSSKLSEKQLNDKTFNVLSSGFYPHNLSFGSIDNNMFILGHQNIIEKYLEANNITFDEENCDIYFYSDIKKLYQQPKKNKKKSFWEKYKNIEVKVFMSPNVNFEGKMVK